MKKKVIKALGIGGSMLVTGYLASATVAMGLIAFCLMCGDDE